MSRIHQQRSNTHRIAGLLVAAIAAVTLASGGSTLAGSGNNTVKGTQNVPDKQAKSLYIVQMTDPPAVAYTGGISGLRATKPAKGQKIDPNSAVVVSYVKYLDGTHNARVAAVGGRKVYSYRFAFNGFTAELTPAQAARLATDARVVAVTKDSIAELDTSTTPDFLGLNAQGGIWSRLSGSASGNPISGSGAKSGGAGEGVIVGIIDSGIWPENPSFSDRDANGKRVYQQLSGWHGKCVPGEAFTATNCNQKLISAQYFGEGFGGAAGIKAAFPYEFISARAADGHGVHTASTAAGNYGVNALIDGTSYGSISGMAPRARIAVYKTCWGIDEGGCPNSDNVAAIDQAVADGVDVLNFSISGTQTNFRDPVEIAFLFAADAGIFVAASAGNSGPGASTVAHPSPWLTTVAASTHDRSSEGTVTLGNGNTYTGASLATSSVTAPIVNSVAVGLAGEPTAKVALCYPGTLDPALVNGKIVVCDRGEISRTDKSQAVKAAGGVGMVLVNTSPNSLNADLHYVPTVHLSDVDRAAINAYAANAGPTTTATIARTASGPVTAPAMAEFSSRGPLLASGGDLLKPDITAPGVDVLAAYSPVAANRNFDFLSGTSMSSPHMAGIAALMKDLYPTWSPAAIKSALMTTAYQTTKTGRTGETFGGPFDFGAGHVAPNAAMNPGVVFDAGFNDWLGFLCGTQLPTSFCTRSGVPVLDPSNLNVPSVAIGDLAGAQTVTRTITNVSGATATFTATASGLTGVNVVVVPAQVALAPGRSATVSISFTNVSAPLNAYVDGAITWTSGAGHTARIPVVVKPVALAAPAAVTGTGAAQRYDVKFGYTGPFTATARGLEAAKVTPGSVAQDLDQTFDPADAEGTVAIPVVIPVGTTYARFALFDSDVAAGADIDLYVIGGGYEEFSASGTSAEEVNLSFATPTAAPIEVTVYVHGWGLPAGTSSFALHEWYVRDLPVGNMTVSAPATATLGATGTISLTFSGLVAATRYLGSIAYGGAAGMPEPTIVSINTP